MKCGTGETTTYRIYGSLPESRWLYGVVRKKSVRLRADPETGCSSNNNMDTNQDKEEDEDKEISSGTFRFG